MVTRRLLGEGAYENIFSIALCKLVKWESYDVIRTGTFFVVVAFGGGCKFDSTVFEKEPLFG